MPAYQYTNTHKEEMIIEQDKENPDCDSDYYS